MVHSTSSRDAGALQADGAGRALWLVQRGESTWNALGLAQGQCDHAAEVTVAVGDGTLRVDIRDDGRGGADFGRGSGLLGLKDRVEALGGWISLQSAAGAGTIKQIALPLNDPGRPGRPPAGPPDEAGHGPG